MTATPSPSVDRPAGAAAANASAAGAFVSIAAKGVLRVPLSLGSAGEAAAISTDVRDVRAGDRLASGVLAPIDGQLGSLTTAALTNGRTVPAVELTPPETAGAPVPVEPIAADHPQVLPATAGPEQLSQWIDRLAAAGVAARRRSSPDLLAQLFQVVRRPVDTVICNLLDADPAAVLNAQLLRGFAREIIAGVVLIARLVKANQTWLAVDERVSLSGAGVRRIARGTSAKIVTMANDYPQPDPTLLLYTLLGRRLRPGRLPVEQGCLVLDGAAAFAVGRLALLDEPMLRVPVAVREHGHADERGRTHYAIAPVGLPLSQLLAQLDVPTAAMCLRGGELLRDHQLSGETVVSARELVIHHSDPEPPVNPDPCVRCGWCFEACPTGVQPANVLDAAQRDDLDAAHRAGVEACIECGICSYVCPSKLPLLQGLRLMRTKLAEDAADLRV
jgi:electron transport complex protein RnfC